MPKIVTLSVVLFCLLATVPLTRASQPLTHDTAACPRYPSGSTLVEPTALFSKSGILRVTLTYRTRTDSSGNVLYCFTAQDGSQSPTLHVFPGDELVITLKNELPPSSTMPSMPGMSNSQQTSNTTITGSPSAECGAMVMSATSVNLHYHGTNVPPVCHQDEVIKTLINAGETFDYDVHFPNDEPPGLYWYHPHIHGISEAAVQGGASGAIIVEGIQNVVPELAGLPQRVLIVRDNPVPASSLPPSGSDDGSSSDIPGWDLSLNYIPVAYPAYTPAVIPIRPLQKQLWRVVNASADTILKLQVQYDGLPQPVSIVALDGVPTNSQDGTTGGHPITRDHILVPPAGRAEFVIVAPSKQVKSARLVTLNVNTGPDGDNDPYRPLAIIRADSRAQNPTQSVPELTGPPSATPRFMGLRSERPVIHRKLYFSEVLSDPNDSDSPTDFYITVDGHKPMLFSPDNPPAIVTTQGSAEDWTIENRTRENHEFHIHQIHFLELERDRVPVPDGQYLDTINVPFWSGKGPYPSVTLRMDFRGNTVGDFVYHCHILGHEDAGMMAIIRILPRR